MFIGMDVMQMPAESRFATEKLLTTQTHLISKVLKRRRQMYFSKSPAKR